MARKRNSKSPKQPLQSGMQSIAQMFQMQRHKVSTSQSHQNTLNSEDGDVIFVKEHKVSPYFNQTEQNDTPGCSKQSSKDALQTRTVKKRKLSLTKGKEKSSKKGGKPSPAVIMNKSSLTASFENDDTFCRDETKSDASEHEISSKCEIHITPQKRWSTQEDSDSKSVPFKKFCSDAASKIQDSDKKVIDPNSSRSDSFCNESDFSTKTSLDCSPSNAQQSEPVHITRESLSSQNMQNDYNETGQNTDGQEKENGPTDSQDSNTIEEQDQSSSGNPAPGSDETLYRIPYYLNNFETILQSVLEDETNKDLFNAEDMQFVSAYQQLSDAAKKLYIRLFSRKLHWIPLNKLKYPEIAEDLAPYLEELAKASFIDCDEHLTDLEEVLNALPAADIKTLAKSYHMNSASSQKGQLVQELLKKSQQSTISTMFGSRGGGVARAMLIRAKKYLDGIYRLRVKPRGIFVRVMMLFSLIHTSLDEESGSGGQGQLFQMLMVNMGKVVYPTYEVDKTHKIFQSRDDVIRFERALQLESDLLQCTQKGKWEQAYEVFKTIEEEWKILEANEDIVKWNENLPDFLRSFTATSVVYRLLSAGIEILQRRKDFDGAVELLEKLLSQELYNCSHRGYWWERLALNLDAHLKQPLKSLEVVAKGLADAHVRVGHRYALFLRAESICQRPKLNLKHRLKEFHHESVYETPKVYIEGRVIHQGVMTNGTRFLTDDSYADGISQDMTVCGVEEYVLNYYRKNGFPSGIHAEGSVVSSLFALFFWDILFMSVPDAFHSPFQTEPLDLHSDMFYTRRKDKIEQRLAKLEESSVEELLAEAEKTWTSQEGVSCAGLGSERMRSLDVVKEMVSCMGGKILSGIVGRYARCPRHTRSGFPDLTLWNVDTGTFKICEVKGPGDRLSHKQILWIDYLLKLGVDAEVCHVKAVAAKKLKPAVQEYE